MKNKRWLNGSDLLESLKVTLAQIYLDDDTDMDIHKIKVFCTNIFNSAIDMFLLGGN